MPNPISPSEGPARSSSNAPIGRWIRRIRVKSLFGRYTYDLALDDRRSPQVLLMYGDNGAGKTNLLRLVFHLLNHQENRGHKSKVAQTLFNSIVVELNDGSLIEARRSKGTLLGAFEMSVCLPGREPVAAPVLTNKDNIVDKSHSSIGNLNVVLAELQRLKVRLYFLSDERELLSNFEPEDLSVAIEAGEQFLLSTAEGRIIRTTHKPQGVRHPVDQALDVALKSVLEWARDQVLRGSRQGEADASSVYADIVNGLTSAPSGGRPSVTQADFDGLLRELEAQAERSADFARVGIPTAANIHKLVEATRAATSEHGAVVRILQPYVETMRARLDALGPVQGALDEFVKTVSSFFVDKAATFNLQMGIRFVAVGGNHIPPSGLSSGEKQLLLLFCNTLIATGKTTIFLIDEPELSLNVKWQRNLVNALLTSTRNRNIQFILATHSFEILAQHRNNVLHLRNDEITRTAAPNGTGATHVS